MDSKNKWVKKMCSFYVSDVHFTTMLLPYIVTKLETENTVLPFLENGMKENIDILVSKLNLKQATEEKLNNVNWNASHLYKYSDFENMLDKKLAKGENFFCIIAGTNAYMEAMNQNLDQYIQIKKDKQKDDYGSITIINCYEVMQVNGSIEEILDKHDKILNTSGEKEIGEVFEGYTKNIV